MLAFRSTPARTALVLILGMTIAACGSGSASAPAPAPTGGATAAATVATIAGASSAAASVAPSVASGAGSTDCSGGEIGRKVFKLAGFDAQHYCGPATATVTAGGSTVAITSGWCETNAAGFSVSIGTQIFGSPSASQEPDLLLVLVDPTTGKGPVSGVVNHKHFLMSTEGVTLSADKKSGTWSGAALVGGTVSGNFVCGN